ncbi:DUF317 domain-containing protein [Kitasatospora sp. NPDC098663]|uniref:DUF317 domain-containing protein n=1 Tax=Kitasatospora sp. NPDC098663 TaxID=3364096 RepID=UPI0038282DB5
MTTDGRIRIGYIPEQDWDTLWRIAVAPAPFAHPRWVANFSASTPEEIVTAVTTELARMYDPEDDAWLDERTTGPLEWIAPYAAAGWTTNDVDRGRLTLISPDHLASVTYRQHPLRHTEAEQLGQDGRFTVGTVKTVGWYGRFSARTPSRILDAVATAMLDPRPVLRYRDALGYYTEREATITPVTPPAPSPLDIQRTAARLRSAAPPAPVATSASLPRIVWTSATPAARRR